MKTQRFILLFALMSVLLAACASPAKTPAASPTEISPPDGGGPRPGGGAAIHSETPFAPVPTDNDTPITFPADTPVLTWQRSGGIAGFCDEVTVLASGAYSVVTCKDKATQNGQLNASQLLQLTRFVNKIQSFENDNNDPPVPDAMSIKITFKGSGTLDASLEDLATLNNFATLLLVQVKPAADGSSYPEAAAKARDALAEQLGIASNEIKITGVEAVEWSDACLGVVMIGMMCAQGITPGYRVMLDAQGQSYEFHTDETGDSIQQVTDPNLVKP